MFAFVFAREAFGSVKTSNFVSIEFHEMAGQIGKLRRIVDCHI